MALADQLDLVIKKVESLNLPFGHKRDIVDVARYLKEQSLCDLDRRAQQKEIAEAALLFVKRIYEVSILASLNQPQKFLEQPRRLCAKAVEDHGRSCE